MPSDLLSSVSERNKKTLHGLDLEQARENLINTGKALELLESAEVIQKASTSLDGEKHRLFAIGILKERKEMLPKQIDELERSS